MAKNGFTLLELLLVITVMGILLGMAIPTYTTSLERSRATEGISILGAVRASQMRYAVDNNGDYVPNGCTITGANNCLLDIEIASLRYFGPPVTGSSPTLATITRGVNANAGFGQYELAIDEDGDITCIPGAVADACDRLGY